jgi:hypothetical protein
VQKVTEPAVTEERAWSAYGPAPDRLPSSRPIPEPEYDYTLQMLRELPYTRWRDLDPEHTIRFYAVRLHEAGMLKTSPQKLIAQGTDWRFLNELKKELKG